MKRKVNIEEVRRHLHTLNKELEEAGLFLHTVHFDRDNDSGELQKIRIFYGRRDTSQETNLIINP